MHVIIEVRQLDWGPSERFIASFTLRFTFERPRGSWFVPSFQLVSLHRIGNSVAEVARLRFEHAKKPVLNHQFIFCQTLDSTFFVVPIKPVLTVGFVDLGLICGISPGLTWIGTFSFANFCIRKRQLLFLLRETDVDIGRRECFLRIY